MVDGRAVREPADRGTPERRVGAAGQRRRQCENRAPAAGRPSAATRTCEHRRAHRPRVHPALRRCVGAQSRAGHRPGRTQSARTRALRGLADARAGGQLRHCGASQRLWAAARRRGQAAARRRRRGAHEGLLVCVHLHELHHRHAGRDVGDLGEPGGTRARRRPSACSR